VSTSSASQRLDATRKSLQEERQKGTDFHEAYSELPAIFLSYIATLKMECEKPTRRVKELGVRVTGSTDDDTGRPIPTSNRAARHELERLQAWMYREGNRGMGTYAKENEHGQVGKIEQIVYPVKRPAKNESHTPVRGVA
jgi:hypothetical protein